MIRFRLKTGPVAMFGAVFVLALIALMPMRLVLGWFDLDRTGFAARAATGTIWSGSLHEGQLGSIALGDVDAGLSPWPLFVGRARLDIVGHMTGATRALQGAISVSRHSIGIDDMTGTLPVGDAFAPLPISGVDLDAVSVRFVNGHCDRAEGRVKATLGGDIGGITLGQGLTGAARCEAGALLLPLVSQAGTEQMAVRLWDSGRFRAEFLVKPSDAAAAQNLERGGFQRMPNGHLLAVEGKF
jgi:general secretion pathway protein N